MIFPDFDEIKAWIQSGSYLKDFARGEIMVFMIIDSADGIADGDLKRPRSFVKHFYESLIVAGIGIANKIVGVRWVVGGLEQRAVVNHVKIIIGPLF